MVSKQTVRLLQIEQGVYHDRRCPSGYVVELGFVVCYLDVRSFGGIGSREHTLLQSIDFMRQLILDTVEHSVYCVYE